MNLYRFSRNSPIAFCDPWGLVWYKPWEWNWDRIGSGIGGELGPTLGIEARARCSKIKGKTGFDYGWGGYGNLGGPKYGDYGTYVHGDAGLKVELGAFELGLNTEYDLKIDSHGKILEEAKKTVGLDWDSAGWKNSDWSKIEIGVSALIHAKLIIDFGVIWHGITD